MSLTAYGPTPTFPPGKRIGDDMRHKLRQTAQLPGDELAGCTPRQIDYFMEWDYEAGKTVVWQ